MSRSIKAVTFDLWDTMIRDESDEPKRAAQGLRSKKDERRHLLWEALNREAPIERAAVDLAYAAADAGFSLSWHGYSVTWLAAERLRVVLTGLGRTLPDAVFDEIVRTQEEMEIVVPPDPVPGIAEALADLARRYRLCVVSDAIVSPGRCLKRLLDLHGLAGHFSGFVFSDEIGHSKPHPSMFESAARQVGCDFPEMLHIGDRDQNDVKGPQALGMKAVLFTAIRDTDLERTSADAVCERHADLPAIVDRLAAEG